MKRIKMVGLCLVAAFALGALAVSSASALPEVGRCQAKADGKYKDANCSEKPGALESEEAFEFVKGAVKVGWTSTGGGSVLETEEKDQITCKTQSATGKYDLDSGLIKEVESAVSTFEGCEFPVLKVKCQNNGVGESGVIKVNPVKGPVGYISGEKTTSPVLGQELTPEIGKLFAEFECGKGVFVSKVKAAEGTVEGRKGGKCIIASEEPANKMTETFTSHFKGVEGKPGQQEPQHFELATATYCNLESNANGGKYEKGTETLTTTLVNEEALEIKA